MGDGPILPVQRRHSVDIHEVALATLGIGTTLALMVRGGFMRPIVLEAAGATMLFGCVILVCRAGTGRFVKQIRFFASYGYVLWFYLAIARLTPALGTGLRDGVLLRIDETIFGQTPAVFCGGVATAWLTDFMSLCYLTYHPYLIVAVVHAALAPCAPGERLSVYLFTGFAIGLAGYLLVPAIGPARAYPELFAAPLPGGWVSRVLADLFAKGSSGYDVFPSLHVLITCILLDHDWRRVRRRFWLMIFPSLGLLFSTIYLRYHYGVDILAGLLVFVALRQGFLKAWKGQVPSAE